VVYVRGNDIDSRLCLRRAQATVYALCCCYPSEVTLLITHSVSSDYSRVARDGGDVSWYQVDVVDVGRSRAAAGTRPLPMTHTSVHWYSVSKRLALPRHPPYVNGRHLRIVVS